MANEIVTVKDLRAFVDSLPPERDDEALFTYDLVDGTRHNIVNLDSQVGDAVEFNYNSDQE
jgi:hypothetical protein